MTEDAGGFLSRWARRKEQVRTGRAALPEPAAAEPMPAAAPVAELPASAAAPSAANSAGTAVEPPPTLADVALLTRESDYARFIAPGIDEGVKRAAMKKLFTDPHFNIMDGLDTYIDDYGKPDPIPLAMLRQMNQSKFLRLFDDDEDEDGEAVKLNGPEHTATAPLAATLTEPTIEADDDPDLRLQQDDVPGRAGPGQGAGA
jgi:hypothetical protein